MEKQKFPRPTEAELDILRVLWKKGPSTVRQVQAALKAIRPSGYTTVLKFLQIMKEKGLVDRDEKNRTHIYRARLIQEEAQKHLVRDLLDRAFEGSARQLVLQALSAKPASAEELRQIQEMLRELEGETQNEL